MRQGGVVGHAEKVRGYARANLKNKPHQVRLDAAFDHAPAALALAALALAALALAALALAFAALALGVPLVVDH